MNSSKLQTPGFFSRLKAPSTNMSKGPPVQEPNLAFHNADQAPSM